MCATHFSSKSFFLPRKKMKRFKALNIMITLQNCEKGFTLDSILDQNVLYIYIDIITSKKNHMISKDF